ncbi:hypothetical protein [Actinocrispum sp. NPDC049592]|uniref:hypothetical protein n=1 Tax=Actinocrispum sp. NPDC049592 TaxID=3154835 RepID=UPI0034474F6E
MPRRPASTELREKQYERAKARWRPGLQLTGSCVLAGLVLMLHGASLVVPVSALVLGVGLSIGSLVWARLRLSAARRRVKMERKDWPGRQRRPPVRAVGPEQGVQATEVRWLPLHLDPHVVRLDVVGGTGDGWASLLATLGSGTPGGPTLLLDFTEQYVGGGLAAFTSAQGFPAHHTELPESLAQLDLLGGLAVDELVEVLVEAIDSLRAEDGRTTLRFTDAALLRVVAEELRPPVTFARLAAGLRVLLRTNPDADGRLTSDEVVRLSARTDAVVTADDRARQDLPFLISVVDLLAQTESAGGRSPQVGLWPHSGLHVIVTTGMHLRRKEVTDQVLFHRVLHELRTRSDRQSRQTLIVAGIDRLGWRNVEELNRHAARVGVRLVLMAENLRDETHRLLGGHHSATVVMQLGGDGAKTAAEFIGHGHKFVLSQVTTQIGRTFTISDGESRGIQDSDSLAKGTSTSGGHNWNTSEVLGLAGVGASRSTGTGDNHSHTESRARTWQETFSRSVADSTTDGRTYSRVYEFTVEPTTIQGLAPTAFILVQPTQAGRQVVAGDCNPGTVALDRADIDDRRITLRRTRRIP